jgi:hypothetical protein
VEGLEGGEHAFEVEQVEAHRRERDRRPRPFFVRELIFDGAGSSYELACELFGAAQATEMPAGLCVELQALCVIGVAQLLEIARMLHAREQRVGLGRALILQEGLGILEQSPMAIRRQPALRLQRVEEIRLFHPGAELGGIVDRDDLIEEVVELRRDVIFGVPQQRAAGVVFAEQGLELGVRLIDAPKLGAAGLLLQHAHDRRLLRPGVAQLVNGVAMRHQHCQQGGDAHRVATAVLVEGGGESEAQLIDRQARELFGCEVPCELP